MKRTKNHFGRVCKAYHSWGIVTVFILTLCCASATAGFQGLGDLSGCIFRSEASAISANGTVVVGASLSDRAVPIGSGIDPCPSEGFVWSESKGMQGLGFLEGWEISSKAYGVSADGSVVVGGCGGAYPRIEAYRWTESGGMVGLGDLEGGYFYSSAYGISDDGSVVVGESCSDSGYEAFLWKDGLMRGLGDLDGGHFASAAFAISGDGKVVVGCSISDLGHEAFRRENDVITGLGDLVGGNFYSLATCVSYNGSVVGGYGESVLGTEAFRWEGGVITGLGDLSGGIFHSHARGVSDDGSVIVGGSQTELGSEAFIWDQENGMRNLKEVLFNDFGLDVADWTLTGATGISSDGLTIVGRGINPQGYSEGWIATLPGPQIVYVDDDVPLGGDGQSWQTAYKYLQDALATAEYGNQIWVAQGVYKPDQDEYGNVTPGDREATFQLVNGVTIKGGYAGFGEPDANARDIKLYETILSGDLDGEDEDFNPNGTNNDENSYHVVTGTNTNETAIFDGFTITAGNADESYPSPHGNGGGMYNYYSNPTVTSCKFSGNSANGTYGLGGGMCNEHYSSPIVANCTFMGNSAYDSGGGMCNYVRSSPTVINCTFSGNLAGYGSFTGYGGGMANYYNSKPIVTGCKFIGNSADFAGGMYNYNSSSPTVTNCTFTGNSAESVFFFGGNGGGMNNESSSSPIVTNCTFTGNLAGLEGGGMYNYDSSSPAVTNCILWGNTAPEGNEIYNENSTPVINYCDITGCGGRTNWDTNLGTDDGGNIDAEPLFIDPNGPDGIIGTEDDNLRLLTGSPCIDTGDNSVVDANSTDLDGNSRILDGDGDGEAIVDMGAYEAVPAIEADVHIVPGVINRSNRMKRVIAIMRLPEGITKRDITDEPFELYAGDLDGEPIEAIWQRVIGWRRRASVFALFDKAELMDAVEQNGRVELTVVSRLKSGQYIYGSDTVRTVQPRGRRPRWRNGRRGR